MFQDGFIVLKIRLKITRGGKIVPLLLWKNCMYSLDSILLIFLETSTRKFRHVHMYVVQACTHVCMHVHVYMSAEYCNFGDTHTFKNK